MENEKKDEVDTSTVALSSIGSKVDPEKKSMPLDEALREKIRGRAKVAFGNPAVKQHRITEVTETSLKYRLPGHMFGKGRYQGAHLIVKKDKAGRVYVPKVVEYS